MRHLPLKVALAFAVLAAATTASWADVHVRIAVRPETIPQCSRGQFLTAIGNSGDHPILVRVSLALTRNDTVLVGPFGGRLRLAAGERRSREFPFFIPRFVPPGRYAWVMRAVASDGSHDAARAPFAVVEGTCPPPPPGATDPAAELQNSIIQGMGLDPDRTSPTVNDSWGSVKKRFKN